MQIQQNDISTKQQTFIDLMDLYEQNYILLRQLVPQLDKISDHVISVRQNAVDLHLEIIERGKYTTTLLLTHRFRQIQNCTDAPNLLIRCYSDARNVEAMSAIIRDKTIIPEPAGLKQRYQLNRFLYKWLTYLLQQQHCLYPRQCKTLPDYLYR